MSDQHRKRHGCTWLDMGMMLLVLSRVLHFNSCACKMRFGTSTVSHIRSWCPELGQCACKKDLLRCLISTERDMGVHDLTWAWCCWFCLECCTLTLVLARWDLELQPFLTFAVGVQSWASVPARRTSLDVWSAQKETWVHMTWHGRDAVGFVSSVAL